MEPKIDCYRIGEYQTHGRRPSPVFVEARGSDKWAIIYEGACLNKSGDWVREGLPSSRTPDFLAETRFSLDDALERAQAVYKQLKTDWETRYKRRGECLDMT